MHTSAKEIDVSTCLNSRKPIAYINWSNKTPLTLKKLFKLINELAGNKDQNPLPVAKSDKDLAEEFAQFFLNKIEKIREQFESSPTYHTNNKDVPKLDNFTAMLETNLYKCIMEMPTK